MKLMGVVGILTFSHAYTSSFVKLIEIVVFAHKNVSLLAC